MSTILSVSVFFTLEADADPENMPSLGALLDMAQRSGVSYGGYVVLCGELESREEFRSVVSVDMQIHQDDDLVAECISTDSIETESIVLSDEFVSQSIQ